MSKRQSILQHAEAFVRAVVERDFKQKTDTETIRAAAIKAAAGIPARPVLPPTLRSSSEQRTPRPKNSH
jgi:hypothetical protein